MTYAMLDQRTGKYLINDKKDFTGSGGFLFLDDAEKFYGKIKIVPTKNEILEQAKEATTLKANTTIKDYKVKY